VGGILDQARAGSVLSDGSRFDVNGSCMDFDPRVNGFMCLGYALHLPQLPPIEADIYQSSPLLLIPLLPEEPFSRRHVRDLAGRRAPR
jgi:hypothetical protein